MLGAILGPEGKYAEAEPMLVDGYRGLLERASHVPKASRFQLAATGAWVVQFYRAWGKPEKAAEWARKLE